jgi:hypothetical protein
MRKFVVRRGKVGAIALFAAGHFLGEGFEEVLLIGGEPAGGLICPDDAAFLEPDAFRRREEPR